MGTPVLRRCGHTEEVDVPSEFDQSQDCQACSKKKYDAWVARLQHIVARKTGYSTKYGRTYRRGR